MDKLVSVVLPVYNAEAFIESALQSILTQDYRHLEILAIDDGSTDGSKAIIERLAASDRRIRLVSRENRGLVASLNEGLDLATGELVARMDADDIAYPTRISTQVRVFAENPGLCLLGMGADLLFPGNYVLRQVGELRTPEEVSTQTLFHPMFVHPTVMFDNRIMSEEKLRYNPRYPRCEDRDLWRRIAPAHKAMLIPEIGLAWRQQHNSVRTLHYREMVIDGLGMLAEEWNKVGVARDLSIFGRLCSGSVEAGPAELEEMTEGLRAIRAMRPRFVTTEEAFDRGCAGVTHNILEASGTFSDMPRVLRAVEAAGFAPFVTRRHRVQAVLTQATSPATARAILGRLRGISRRIKGRKITQLVELPPEVIDCLPA